MLQSQPPGLDYTKIVLGVFVVIVGLLQIAYGYIFKRHVEDDDELKRMFNEHVRLYNQTPNALLLAEIRNLTVNINDKHESNTNMISIMNGEVTKIRDETQEAAKKIAVIEGRLNVPRRA